MTVTGTGKRLIDMRDTDPAKPEPARHWVWPMAFVIGACGLAMFLWRFIAADGRVLSPEAMSGVANSVACLCFASAGMYPRTPVAPRLQGAAQIAIVVAVFFMLLPVFT